jgi:chromate transporter
MRRPGWSPTRIEGFARMQGASYGMGAAVIALAAPGVFLLCDLFTIIPAPYFRELSQDRPIKAVVDGVTAAATGAIGGAVLILGQRAIVDVPTAHAPTALIALATLGLLIWVKKVPEPLVIVAAGGRRDRREIPSLAERG